MTWYFIVYHYKYISKITRNSQDWSDDEIITEEHPIKFLITSREKYGEDEHAIYNYRIIFWTEIPKSIALQFKDKFD